MHAYALNTKFHSLITRGTFTARDLIACASRMSSAFIARRASKSTTGKSMLKATPNLWPLYAPRAKATFQKAAIQPPSKLSTPTSPAGRGKRHAGPARTTLLLQTGSHQSRRNVASAHRHCFNGIGVYLATCFGLSSPDEDSPGVSNQRSYIQPALVIALASRNAGL